MVRVDSLALLLILGEIHCLSHLNMMLAYSLFVGALCQVEEIQLLFISKNFSLFFYPHLRACLLFLQRGEGRRERGREKIDVREKSWSLNPQPRHVPWLRIELVTLSLWDDAPTNWAIPARVQLLFLICWVLSGVLFAFCWVDLTISLLCSVNLLIYVDWFFQMLNQSCVYWKSSTWS